MRRWCLLGLAGLLAVGYTALTANKVRNESRAVMPDSLRVLLFAADVCTEAYRKARTTGETEEDFEAMGVQRRPKGGDPCCGY